MAATHMVIVEAERTVWGAVPANSIEEAREIRSRLLNNDPGTTAGVEPVGAQVVVVFTEDAMAKLIKESA